MIKKVISGIMCVSMLTAFAVTAMADKEEKPITGWEKSFIQYETGNTDPLGVEIVTEEEKVANGKASLYVWGIKDNNNNYNANAVQNIPSLEDGSSYRLTGKFYVSRNTWRIRLMFGEKQIIQLGDLTKDGEELRLNEWVDVDYTFEYTASAYNSSKDFRIQVAGLGYVYADDLSIKKVIYNDDQTTVSGYGEELLVNGDFEADFIAPSEADYVLAAPANGVVYIAVKTTHPSEEIYRVLDDNSLSRLELAPVYTYDSYNLKVYAHTGLENNKTYKYIIKTVGTNGLSSEGTEVTAMPSAIYDDYITSNSWKYRVFGNSYGTVSYVTDSGHNSSKAIKITKMTDSDADHSYIYIATEKTVNLEKDKVYKFSFWASAGEHNTRSDSFDVRMTKAYSSLDGKTFATEVNKGVGALNVSSDGEWSEQVCYFKASDIENGIEIRIHRHFEELLLDDFTLYEVDEDLNVVPGAVDLLADKNGDFEDMISPEFKTEFKFYPAYSDDEQFGDIMDPQGITSLSDLEMYDTDVIYAEVTINNEVYEQAKPFTYILAVYKDSALYDVRLIKSSAAYLPSGAEGEKFGIAYRIPDMSQGKFSVKTFVWNDCENIEPLGAGSGNIR